VRDNRDGPYVRQRTLTNDKASSAPRSMMALWLLGLPDKEEVVGQAGEKDVLFLKQLIEAGKYREVIDRSYPRLCRNLCVRPSPCIPGNSCRGGNHYGREECISQSRRSDK
jgi:hypothetical protein